VNRVAWCVLRNGTRNAHYVLAIVPQGHLLVNLGYLRQNTFRSYPPRWFKKGDGPRLKPVAFVCLGN
jgi:hypothetical protein